MAIKVVTENDVDNVTIIINSDNKLQCVPTPAPETKVFTDEYNFLMDACGCGAYITRQTSEGQAVVVDYVKFTGKYTKTHIYGSHIEYVGTSSSKKLYSVLGNTKLDTAIDYEGDVTNYISGTTLSTDQASGNYTDYTYEALDCCATGATGGIEIEELPYGEFVDDNNVPNDYALRLVVGNQEVGIDKVGVIKGTQWLVFKASKFDLTQPVA